MKLIRSLEQEEVWRHWMQVEQVDDPNFRLDIRGDLPSDLEWLEVEIERQDFAHLYVISSGDWHAISAGSFRVFKAAAGIDQNSANEHVTRLSEDILDKVAFDRQCGGLDHTLIAVSCGPGMLGPYTLIEGNRRAVAFAFSGTLLGTRMFVGVSDNIRHYPWANAMFG